MRKGWLCLLMTAALWPGLRAYSQENAANEPGCNGRSAKQCLDLALEAMGGSDRLVQVKGLRLQTVSHTALAEQSYRQEPFIASYERSQTTLDLANQRLLADTTLTWPEADPNNSEFKSIWVASNEGCVIRGKNSDSPCPLSSLEAAREMLALGPSRVLLTASQAADLHYEPPESLRSTLHSVIAFSWRKIPVRVLLNAVNHLPDAVETTQEFHDFWYFWGDVRQRVYFDGWQLFSGILYPTNTVVERNGMIWRSTQVLNVEFNVPIDDKQFAMDANAAHRSLMSPGWNRPFRGDNHVLLAPGVDLFLGSWNTTIVKQPDGILILEAPISGLYAQGVLDEARKRYPGMPIKAVLSTSDSWPHTGGVRFAVAQGLPVYILGLNRPLLDRLMSAPHTLDPDALENARNARRPDWRIVSKKELVGNGENRLELYPLCGPSTERQYMVYFPESRLLYASDTLALNEDGSLYDPELMREVVQTAKQANLKVDTVFSMHHGPMPWRQVLTMLDQFQQD